MSTSAAESGLENSLGTVARVPKGLGALRNFSSEKQLKAPDEKLEVNHIGITWKTLPVSPESGNGATCDHTGEAALWVGGKSGRPQAPGILVLLLSGAVGPQLLYRCQNKVDFMASEAL